LKSKLKTDLVWDWKTIDEIKSEKRNAIAMGPFGSNITKDNFVSHGIPVIRGTNLSHNRFIEENFVFLTEEKADQLKSSNAFPEDIVLTHRGTLGQVAIIPKNSKFKRYVVSQSQMKFSCDPTMANPLFVYYYLISPDGQFNLLSHTSTTGVPALAQPLTALKGLKIPSPSLTIQKRISEILETLDHQIISIEKQNNILEKIIQTVFKSMFVDFDGQTKFVDSECGEIPLGWGIKRLGEVFNVTDYTANGSFAKLRENVTYSYIPDYAILVRQSDFNKGWNGEYVYVDKHSYDFLKKSSLEKGDVVVSNIGSIGIVFRVPNLGMPMTSAPNVLVVKTDDFQKEFVYCYLSSNIGQQTMISISGGSAHPKFNKTDFRSIKLIYPPKNLLENFHKITFPIYNVILENQEKLNILKKIRDTLLPKLMSGEIQV